MEKTDVEWTLTELKNTQAELKDIYLKHVLTLTEAGAGSYALEKLDLEHEMLNIKLNRAIENCEYMLARM
jgi:hypothetical protein